MALTLNKAEIQAASRTASRGQLNDDIDDGLITREDAQAILSAKGDSLESINDTFPFQDDTLLIPLIASGMHEVTDAIGGMLTERVNNASGDMVGNLNDITDVILGKITPVIDSIELDLATIETNIRRDIDFQAGNILKQGDLAEETIIQLLNEAYLKNQLELANMDKSIMDRISEFAFGSDLSLSETESRIMGSIDKAREVVEEGNLGISGFISNFAEILKKELPELASNLGQSLLDTGKEVVTGIKDAAGSVFNLFF